MSKTISTSGSPRDIDGTIAVDARSLEQRIHTAFRFRKGEWFYNITEGLDFDLLSRHNINANQAAQVLLQVIRNEGGNEISEIRDVTYENDPVTRLFVFQCEIDTIYGQTIVIAEGF